MNWLIKILGLTPTPSAHVWTRKWTTWLQAIQMAVLAVIGLFITFPDRWQQLVPEKAIIGFVVFAAVITFITVVANNVLQTKLVTPVRYDPLATLPPDSGTDRPG